MRTALPSPRFLVDQTAERRRKRAEMRARVRDKTFMGITHELGMACGETLNNLAACTMPRMRQIYRQRPEVRADLRKRWRGAFEQVRARQRQVPYHAVAGRSPDEPGKAAVETRFVELFYLAGDRTGLRFEGLPDVYVPSADAIDLQHRLITQGAPVPPAALVMPASDIRRAHARACEEIGIPHWGNLVDERRGLRESEAQALLRVPSLAGEIHDLWESSEHPWDFEIGWSEVYLRVAAHGATLLGLSLVWQVIEAEVIDAGGEAFGYVQ